MIRNSFEQPFFKKSTPENPKDRVEIGPEIIKIPVIRELYKPTQEILRNLHKRINAGEYAAILGDDTSGRLPALLFKKILGDIYREKRFNSPKIIFCTGRSVSQEEIIQKIGRDFKDFLEKTVIPKIIDDKKILVVTDTIGTGTSLLPFTRVLKDMGINFDIVAIGLLGNRTGTRELQEKLGGQIFYGQRGTPSIYTRHEYSGVQKGKGTSIHSEVYRRSPEPSEDSKLLLKIRTQARQDINVLAEKLIEWYRKKFL